MKENQLKIQKNVYWSAVLLVFFFLSACRGITKTTKQDFSSFEVQNVTETEYQDESFQKATMLADTLVRESAAASMQMEKPIRQSIFEKEAYRQALALLLNNNSKAARTAFKQFQKTWPNSSYMPSVLFWIGESYYSEKSYVEALLVFELLWQEYPQSPKIKDALRQAAFCCLYIENKETSEIYLQKILTQLDLQGSFSQVKFLEEKLQASQNKKNLQPSVKISPSRTQSMPTDILLQSVIDTPQGLYKNALAELLSGKSESARQQFFRFQMMYPKSTLMPNVWYWLGESYYVEGRYIDALLNFKAVWEQYPNSAKIPDAMLKAGYSCLRLQNRESAELYLKTILEKYPRSHSAVLAHKSLQGM